MIQVPVYEYTLYIFTFFLFGSQQRVWKYLNKKWIYIHLLLFFFIYICVRSVDWQDQSKMIRNTNDVSKNKFSYKRPSIRKQYSVDYDMTGQKGISIGTVRRHQLLQRQNTTSCDKWVQPYHRDYESMNNFFFNPYFAVCLRSISIIIIAITTKTITIHRHTLRIDSNSEYTWRRAVIE